MYDVVVVGAGATGGCAAQALTERGLRVCLVDGGRLPQRPVETSYWSWEHVSAPVPAEARERQPVQSRAAMYNGKNYRFFVDDVDHPYSSAESDFTWLRGRHVGGRSILWGGQTWRMSDHELSQGSEAGRDWPIRYAELSPFYERVERLLQVRGATEGNASIPDGVFSAPPSPLTPAESLFRERLGQHWPTRPMIRIRSVNKDITLPGASWPISTSLGSTIHLAQQTGLLDMLPDAAVRRILPEAPGQTTRQVEVVDATTGSSRLIEGRAVVLAASTVESVRILLNSSSEQHPSGLGNSSGLLGRGFMDHWCATLFGRLSEEWPQATEQPPVFWNGDGLFIPRYRNLDQRRETFDGGYGIWVAVGREGLNTPVPIPKGRMAFFWIVGETLANDRNRIEIDPDRVDHLGIPSVRIRFAYSENERAATKRAIDDVQEMAASVGIESVDVAAQLIPGISIHEMGGARMGSNAGTSVTNPDNQLWDDPRVLVVDGACWPTGGYQNPTLTMMAITLRAAERLADRLQGEQT